MTIFEIPLVAAPQTLTISLAGVQYNLLVYWNTASNVWVMNIYDTSNNPLILGVPLVAGTNLLAQYDYVGIGGAMVVQTDSDPNADPTYTNLGVTSHLFFIPAAS